QRLCKLNEALNGETEIQYCVRVGGVQVTHLLEAGQRLLQVIAHIRHEPVKELGVRRLGVQRQRPAPGIAGLRRGDRRPWIVWLSTSGQEPVSDPDAELHRSPPVLREVFPPQKRRLAFRKRDSLEKQVWRRAARKSETRLQSRTLSWAWFDLFD